MVIRHAVEGDAPSISALVGQLGYPAPAEVIPERLEKLCGAGGMAMVAEDADGSVVGLVTAHTIWSIHDDPPVAWITTLVVLDSARGSGIGSMLVGRAEEWARQKGAHRISVTSGVQRLDAHVFYDNRGYERSGLRFTKKFGAG